MTQTVKPDLPALAEALASSLSPRTPEEQRLALVLYRRLAEGEPVPVAALASDLHRDPTEVEATLERWTGVFRSDDGDVVGFWGLSIPEMPHRFRVDGRQLFTWCAWDTLFVPKLIRRTAVVESRSPTSGEPVRLTVAPQGVVELEPDATVVSMLAPTEAFDDNVITGFCHFVHFFPSAANAAPWLAEHEGTFLLSVPEAMELGQRVNRLRYPDELDR